jgi:DDE superfamily endonuclease
VCFDEWGPLELRPIGGVTWSRSRRPARMRATYRRPHGTEQFLGFYDVHADCLSGVFRRRKRVAEVSEAFRRLRACYPRRRLFVIMDNLRNVHDHPRFLTLLRRLRIQPVPTPTEASWLNLIEAQFGVLKRFTLANTDDASHGMRRRRIYRYLRYRHRTLGRLRHPLNRIRSIRPIKLERH